MATAFAMHHAQTFPSVVPPLGVHTDLSPARLPSSPPAAVLPAAALSAASAGALPTAWPTPRGEFTPTPSAYGPRLDPMVAGPTPLSFMQLPVLEAREEPTGWKMSREAAALAHRRLHVLQCLRSESLFALRIPDVFRGPSDTVSILNLDEAVHSRQVARTAHQLSPAAKGLEPCDEQPWLDGVQQSLTSTWQSLMSSVNALSGNWCMHDDFEGPSRRWLRTMAGRGDGIEEPWFVRTLPPVRPDLPGGQPSPFAAARAPFLKANAADEVQATGASKGRVQQPLSLGQAKQILQQNNSFVVSLKGNKSTAPNQDRASIVNLGTVELLTVCDGHGELGHDVADASSEVLPKLLLQQVARIEGSMSPAGVPNKEARNPQEAAAAVSDLWREAAVQSFEELHRLIEASTALSLDGKCKDLPMDARCSGTTATIAAVVRNQRILVAHVGDSRAVLGIQPLGGPWMVKELTRDHKPELPDERARVERSGAQVITVGQPPNVTCRIYSHQQAWPSINMSRSLGDLHAHSQGLTSEAEVTCTECSWESSSRAALILASDGIWDVLESRTAVNMAWQAFQKGADPASALAQEAYARWERRGLQAGYTDDITVIVRFLSSSE